VLGRGVLGDDDVLNFSISWYSENVYNKSDT
jgi:hypothetical protein